MTELATRILAIIVELRGSVSFAELERRVQMPAGMTWTGDHAICSSRDPNIILWAGVSKPVVDALNELANSKSIEYRSADLLIYMIDGKMLRFPTLSRWPSKPLKTERWIPVVMYPARGSR